MPPTPHAPTRPATPLPEITDLTLLALFMAAQTKSHLITSKGVVNAKIRKEDIAAATARGWLAQVVKAEAAPHAPDRISYRLTDTGLEFTTRLTLLARTL